MQVGNAVVCTESGHHDGEEDRDAADDAAGREGLGIEQHGKHDHDHDIAARPAEEQAVGLQAGARRNRLRGRGWAKYWASRRM